MVGFADFAREHETALEVSVSEERDGDGNGDERFDGVTGADHVFIFVERGAVDELNVGKLVDVDGTLRKRAEPFEIFGSELVARPERGEAGDGVEVLKVHEAADGFVVIATDEHASQSLRFGNDFVRIAAVADRVSEIDDEVVSRSGSQTGVQRFEVAVNVAKKKDTHKGRIIAFPEGNDEAHLLSVVGQFHDANLQRPEPPRTRSTTKAFSLTHFLRVPSWPWWLMVSQNDPLPTRQVTSLWLELVLGLDLLFRQLAFREEIGQRNEHKDEERDANIEKRERHRGQVEEQGVEILELDAAMVVDHVRIVTMVLNNRRAQQGEGQRAQRQHNSIQSYGAGITRMGAHEGGDEGGGRHPEQENVIRPEQAGIGAASGVQHVMMIHPHDGDHEKA